jgi:hypothetical protein
MTKTAKRPATGRHCLSAQLKDIIASRDLAAYAVGRLAGVDPGVVQRFLTGERDIRLGTADRIGAALGLRLVEVGGKARGRAARRGEAGPAAEAPAPAPTAPGSLGELVGRRPVPGADAAIIVAPIAAAPAEVEFVAATPVAAAPAGEALGARTVDNPAGDARW